MWKFAIGLLIGALLLTPKANAQFARQEVLGFESATMSEGDFLTGKPGTPVTLAGYLRLPKANEKNPVVVLFHGAGGLLGEAGMINEWSRVLNEAGIATFAVDSFAGRGVATLATRHGSVPLAEWLTLTARSICFRSIPLSMPTRSR